MKTEPARPPFIIKLLPSMADFAFLLPLAFLFGRMQGVKTLLSDCDTGWHIRTGEWILANHQIPAHDVFSFSRFGAPWYAWEWLSDVLFALWNDMGGLATVVVAAILLLGLTFLLLFQLARRNANVLVAFGVTALAAIISSIHWLARPHLFSFVFFVLFYAGLERVRDGQTRIFGIPILAIFPAATILWTNLHGGFFLGIVLIGAYAGGDFLKLLLAAWKEDRRPALVRIGKYTLSATGCLLASFINPYSYHLHQHVIEYLGDSYQADHIVEFLSISFHNPIAIFLELLLLLGVCAAFWNAARGSYTEPVLVVVFGHAALLASRNLPLYAIVATPIIATALDRGLHALPRADVAGWLCDRVEGFLSVAHELAETEAIGRWHIFSAAAILVIAAIIYAPAPPRTFRPEYDPQNYPAAAVAMLKKANGARIFSNDEWGDYLIWRLYPKFRVFVDGRSDFYGDDFEKKYLDVLSVKYGWEKTLASYGIDTILLPPSTALAGALKESHRWRVVYDDGIAVVFRPAASKAGYNIVAAPAASGARDAGAAKLTTGGLSGRAKTQNERYVSRGKQT